MSESSKAVVPERELETLRQSFVLTAIDRRRKDDPKFGGRDELLLCNFGSLDTYSGVTADLALHKIGTREHDLTVAREQIQTLRSEVNALCEQLDLPDRYCDSCEINAQGHAFDCPEAQV